MKAHRPPRIGSLQATGDKAVAWENFASRIVEARAVWSVTSDEGPVGANGLDGSAAQPYWSSFESARAMVQMATPATDQRPPAGRVRIVQISLREYLTDHLPRMVEQHILVGIDWGTDKRGWVVDPSVAQAALRLLVHRRLN